MESIRKMHRRDSKVSMVEIKAGIPYGSSDVSAFRQQKAGSREISLGCIVCNSGVPYPVTDEVIALPVTSI